MRLDPNRDLSLAEHAAPALPDELVARLQAVRALVSEHRHEKARKLLAELRTDVQLWTSGDATLSPGRLCSALLAEAYVALRDALATDELNLAWRHEQAAQDALRKAATFATMPVTGARVTWSGPELREAASEAHPRRLRTLCHQLDAWLDFGDDFGRRLAFGLLVLLGAFMLLAMAGYAFQSGPELVGDALRCAGVRQ
jgi:hypothetical protein